MQSACASPRPGRSNAASASMQSGVGFPGVSGPSGPDRIISLRRRGGGAGHAVDLARAFRGLCRSNAACEHAVWRELSKACVDGSLATAVRFPKAPVSERNLQLRASARCTAVTVPWVSPLTLPMDGRLQLCNQAQGPAFRRNSPCCFRLDIKDSVFTTIDSRTPRLSESEFSCPF